MTDDQPHFRFHPGAYLPRGSFEVSTDVCEVCARPCTWKYTGCVYIAGDDPLVCARCIADGRLAEAFFQDGHCSLHDINLTGADPALEDELLHRTPQVSSFNPYPWPVLDGTPLAFVGYGEDEDLIRLPEVRQAIDEEFKSVGWKFEGPTPYALIFKELDGERYRAVLDLD